MVHQNLNSSEEPPSQEEYKPGGALTREKLTKARHHQESKTGVGGPV